MIDEWCKFWFECVLNECVLKNSKDLQRLVAWTQQSPRSRHWKPTTYYPVISTDEMFPTLWPVQLTVQFSNTVSVVSWLVWSWWMWAKLVQKVKLSMHTGIQVSLGFSLTKVMVVQVQPHGIRCTSTGSVCTSARHSMIEVFLLWNRPWGKHQAFWIVISTTRSSWIWMHYERCGSNKLQADGFPDTFWKSGGTPKSSILSNTKIDFNRSTRTIT